MKIGRVAACFASLLSTLACFPAETHVCRQPCCWLFVLRHRVFATTVQPLRLHGGSQVSAEMNDGEQLQAGETFCPWDVMTGPGRFRCVHVASRRQCVLDDVAVT
jgi:hypothetical protein